MINEIKVVFMVIIERRIVLNEKCECEVYELKIFISINCIFLGLFEIIKIFIFIF